MTLTEEYLFSLFVWSIINYFGNATDVVKWTSNSCRRPHPATDRPPETIDPIDWMLPPTLYGTAPTELHLQIANAFHKSVPLSRIEVYL